MTILNNSVVPMEYSNNSLADNSQSNITAIIQIPLFVLIIILASGYIILVLSRKTLRSNKFNWLTLNVCLASIFFAIIQLFSTGIHLNNISQLVIPCRLKGFLIDMATCHIMYSHCITSFCRLLSIHYPHKLFFRSRHWLLSNIITSGIIPLVIALPYLFFDGFACTSSYGQRFLQIYTSFSTIFIPVIIVTICNIAVFRYVRQSSKRVHDLNNHNRNQRNKRDMYLCKIILVTFCIFVIGWTPLFVEQLFFNDQNSLPSAVTTLFKILPPTSLLADVILLIYSDHPVRTLLIKAVKCHGIIPCKS
jgi:hypothetical protein